MFDFGFSELLVVFMVALVVLGPTRLPGLVRKVGRWVGKARSMAREFRGHCAAAFREAPDVCESCRHVRLSLVRDKP